MIQGQQTQLILEDYSSRSRHQNRPRLRICTRDKILWLFHDEIQHLQSESNYTYIYYNGGKILSAKTMKRYADQIMDTGNFIRPHHSFIVNKRYIKCIDKKDKSITLFNDTSIPISRINRKNLMNLFH